MRSLSWRYILLRIGIISMMISLYWLIIDLNFEASIALVESGAILLRSRWATSEKIHFQLNRRHGLLLFIALCTWLISILWLFFDPAPEPTLVVINVGLAIATFLIPESFKDWAGAIEKRRRQLLVKRIRYIWLDKNWRRLLGGLPHLPIQIHHVIGNGRYTYREIDAALSQNPTKTITLWQIFEPDGKRILVLGERGSGKTILLLAQLLPELVFQAEMDLDNLPMTKPLPVFLNLSSWTLGRKPMKEWIIEEMQTQYKIPSSISRAWLEGRALVFLFDGLGEVGYEHFDACAEALNEFEESYWRSIVVCCNTAAIKNLVTPILLTDIVQLQPLTNAQVREYVAQHVELHPLQTALNQNDARIINLARIPLWLNIMATALRDLSSNQVQQLLATDNLRSRIFSYYIRKRFDESDEPIQYSRMQTMKWLSWLAQRMERTSSIFFIERMQPDWLASNEKTSRYFLHTRLIIGLMLGISMGLTVPAGPVVGLFLGIVCGLIGGRRVGIIDMKRYRSRLQSENVTAKSVGWKELTSAFFTVGWQVGVRVAVVIFIFITLVSNLGQGLTVGILYGVIFGTLFGIIFGVRGRKMPFPVDIRAVERLAFGWRKALKGGGYGLLVSLLVGLIIQLGYQTLEGISTTPSEDLFFLILFGCIIGLVLSPPFVLVGGLVGGLSSEEPERRLTPNQGISSSLSNALLSGSVISLVVGVTNGVRVGTLVGIMDGSEYALATGLFAAIEAVLVIAVPFALWFGGIEVIFHAVLRLLVYREGNTPRKYADFLDYVVRQKLLIYVGGGYQFIHGLFQEYVAGGSHGESV